MIYLGGKPDHKLSNADMIEHIVELVEAHADKLS